MSPGAQLAPLPPQGTPGVWGCWQWETEASAPRTEGHWGGQAKVDSPRPCPTHLGLEVTGWAAHSETARALPGNEGMWGPKIPQLLDGRLRQENLQCLVTEEE